MLHLFVVDDSLNSWIFTTRTEQVTKCCEPMQKMRVRLGACKIGLSTTSPSSFILLILLLLFYLVYVLESNFCAV